MFSHHARFHGGPKDGQHTTILTETPETPPLLFVATDILPQLRFEKSRYRHTDAGQYEFDGVIQ